MSATTMVSPAPQSEHRHPYDYYHRPGMALRPPPSRLQPDAKWDEARARYFHPWLADVADPHELPMLRLFKDHYWQGDELMDAVVTRFREIGAAQGRALLDQALDHGIDSVPDAPPELVALFESLDNPPAWHDPDEWELGRRLWVDCATSSKLGMGMLDFVITFVGEEVASATGATGRMTGDSVRRQLETLTWFHAVTRPGAMDRFAPEFKDTVRVRLMHAQVRAGLRRSWGDDHFARHGNPISTSHTAAGGTFFGLLPMLIDHAHGRTKTPAEIDAVMRYWSYLTYVFGATPAVIPTRAVDGIAQADYLLSTLGGPNEWSDLMTGTTEDLVEALPAVQQMASRVAADAVVGLIASFLGEAPARALVSATPFRHASVQPWATVAGLVTSTEVKLRIVGDRLPLKDRRISRRGRQSDPVYRWAVGILARLARRHGVDGTPYDSHDETASIPAGCPVH